jgi:hypothetical protein
LGFGLSGTIEINVFLIELHLVWRVLLEELMKKLVFAKKGLNHHEKCLLCDQAEETLDHLLVACSFSRVFWYQLFRKFGLHSLAPQPAVTSFLNWWEEVSEVVSGVTRKGLNSLIILGAWTIWIHRNKCVFDGLSPCLTYILAWADEERSRWEAAGAKALCSLAASAAAP